MLSTVLEILKGLLQAIPIFAKYFPPESTEQKVEDAQTDADAEGQAMKDSGRP